MFLVILLDTNFIILPIKIGKNIKSEIDSLLDFNYKMVLLEESISELKKISLKFKNNSLYDLGFINKIWPGIKIIKSEGKESTNVDDKILQTALINKFIVATNDMLLRRKLKKSGIPTIFLRQKRYIKIDTQKPLSEYLLDYK